MVRKAQGESTPKQLETGTCPPSRFPAEEQIVSQLLLPSRTLGGMVPLGKSNLADTVDPSLLPGGLWRAGRSGGERQPQGHPALGTQLSFSIPSCLGEQGCHLPALGRGTNVTLLLQVWARHCSLIIPALSAAEHGDSVGQGTFSLPWSIPGLCSAYLSRAVNLGEVQEKVFPFLIIICNRNNNIS